MGDVKREPERAGNARPVVATAEAGKEMSHFS